MHPLPLLFMICSLFAGFVAIILADRFGSCGGVNAADGDLPIPVKLSCHDGFEEFCQARIWSAGESYSTAQPSGAFSRKDAANACGLAKEHKRLSINATVPPKNCLPSAEGLWHRWKNWDLSQSSVYSWWSSVFKPCNIKIISDIWASQVVHEQRH